MAVRKQLLINLNLTLSLLVNILHTDNDIVIRILDGLQEVVIRHSVKHQSVVQREGFAVFKSFDNVLFIECCKESFLVFRVYKQLTVMDGVFVEIFA